MKFDTYFTYQIKNILKFAIFSLFIFFVMIYFIIGNDFGVFQALFSFLYGLSIGLIYELTNSVKFYARHFIVRNIIRAFALLVSTVLLIAFVKYFNDSLIKFESVNGIDIAFSKDFIYIIINIFIVTFFIVLFIELESHLGNKFIWNFIFSKYNKPIEEDRVVMFLDLRDSTTIAERIGNQKFVGLVNMCYKVMIRPILKNKAEILKYVGDEVILTWKKEKGIAHNNCINFYFDFNDALEENKEEFIEEFGVLPKFKAGVHVGKVTAAFLGAIKKQMDYSGDVMNTTARIESICNKYNEDILISEDLASQLDKTDKYEFIDIGDVELKGKTIKVSVNKIRFKEEF